MLGLTAKRAGGNETATCRSLAEIRNRHVATWQKKGFGKLLWAGHVFEIRWNAGEPVVSSSANASQCEAVTVTVRQRCTDLADESLHRARNGIRGLRLNGQIPFRHDRSARIVCRHLAVYWLDRVFERGDDGPDYASHFTPEAIGQHIGEHTDRMYDDAKRLCEIRVVHNEQWGAQLGERLRELQTRGEAMTGYLIVTPDHAMAAALHVGGRDGQRLYRIQFYEPGDGATHLEAVFDETDRLIFLKGTDFTTIARASSQRRGVLPGSERIRTVDATLWVEVGPRQMRMLRDRQTPAPDLPRKLSGPLPSATADALWILLRYGCKEALSKLAPAFRQLPVRERIARLQSAGRTQPFFDLLAHGHPDTVPLFGQLIEGLPLEERAVLLQSASADGTSAFAMALRKRRHEMIRPFWKLVKNQLPAELHYSLLAAEEPHGGSALYWAMARDDGKLVSEFVQATTDMPAPLFAALMSVRGPRNQSGLVASMQNTYGTGKVATAFEKVLKRLPNDARVALLEPDWRWLQTLEGTPEEHRWPADVVKRYVRVYAPALMQGAWSADGSCHRAPTLASRIDAVATTLQAGIAGLWDSIGFNRLAQNPHVDAAGSLL